MKEPKYKVGDRVRVVFRGSTESEEKLGQIVTIVRIKYHSEYKRYSLSTGDKLGGGIWFEEVRHLTKLEKALQ